MTLDEVKTLIHTLKYVEDNSDIKFDLELNIKTIVSINKNESESKDESISDESKSRNYWINEDNVIIAPCNIRCPHQLGFGYDQTITCTL